MATGKERRTFISYSRVNKEFAVRLARELKSAGFPVWLDQLDIPPGARWDDELEHALETCEIFMIILTPASMASDNVKDEMGYAIDTGKRVLPVLLENATIPLRLRRFQYVDFTGKSYDEGVESAKQLLQALIDEPTIPRVELSDDARQQLARAEEDRKAREEAERLTAQKAEAERSAKRKADEELAAKARAETERKAKEEREAKAEADRKARMGAKPAVAPTAQKKPVSRGLVIGVVAVVLIICAVIGVSALSNLGTPAVTEAPAATEAAAIIEPTRTEAVAPTQIAPTRAAPTKASPTKVVPTTAELPTFFTTQFNTAKDLENYEYFVLGDGSESRVDVTPSNDGLQFLLNDQSLYVYYIYKPWSYDNIVIRMRAENVGTLNNNNITLVCRRNGDTWYEFSVTSGGLWDLYNASNGTYDSINNGGTTALKTGQNVNEFEMRCIGNQISLHINGQEVTTIENSAYTEGQVGFSVSSLDIYPIEVLVSEFEISEP